MAEILMFHHALGMSDGMTRWAARLEEDGHRVHAPDLFGGRRFDTIEAGMSYVEELGFSEILARGQAAADGLPSGLVYLGFSLGVLPAQLLAQTRDGARGAVLCYSCVPRSEFGQGWPTGVPAQIHGMAQDPFFAGEGDLDAAQDIVASHPAEAELFLYEGDQHYFAEWGAPSCVPAAAELMATRILEFLRREV